MFHLSQLLPLIFPFLSFVSSWIFFVKNRPPQQKVNSAAELALPRKTTSGWLAKSGDFAIYGSQFINVLSVVWNSYLFVHHVRDAQTVTPQFVADITLNMAGVVTATASIMTLYTYMALSKHIEKNAALMAVHAEITQQLVSFMDSSNKLHSEAKQSIDLIVDHHLKLADTVDKLVGDLGA
jgi:hypothetical protein